MATPKVTKDLFFADRAKRGVSEGEARQDFRERYGYFPEEVGRDVDLTDLEPGRREMPRDRKGRIPVGLGTEEGPVEDPATAGWSVLPPGANDEDDLRKKLIKLRDAELDIHPLHVGRVVPQGQHLGGKDQRDVKGFVRAPMTGPEGRPVYQVDFERPEELDRRGETSLRSLGDIPRAVLPDEQIRARKTKDPDQEFYIPRVELSPSEQLRMPGVLRRVGDVLARRKASERPATEPLVEEVKTQDTEEKYRDQRPSFDVRILTKGQVRQAKEDISKAKENVAREWRARVMAKSNERNLPRDQTEKLLDATIQDQLETDDKSIATLLWAALSRVHNLVRKRDQEGEGALVDLESILDMPVKDLRDSVPIFYEPPPGLAQEGPVEYNDTPIRDLIPGASNKKMRDYLQFLYSQLSLRGRTRLSRAMGSQDDETYYNTNLVFLDRNAAGALTAKFRKSPLAIHPLDIVSMYREVNPDEKPEEAPLKDRTLFGESDEYTNKWKEWNQNWKPWLWNIGAKPGEPQDIEKAADVAAMKGFRKADTGFGMEVARPLASLAGLAVGAVKGLGDIGAADPVFSPGTTTKFRASSKKLRPMTRAEKADIKALIRLRNIGRYNQNYLTPRQWTMADNMQTYASNKFDVAYGMMEEHIAQQIDKTVIQAIDEEVDTLIEMLPTVAGVALGTDEIVEAGMKYPESGLDVLMQYYSRSEAFGEEMSTAIAAGLLSLMRDPLGNLQAYPVTTTLTLWGPVFRTLRAGSRWAKLPEKTRAVMSAVIDKSAKIKEVMSILTKGVPTIKGLQRLKELKGIASAKAIKTYEAMLSKVDYVRNAAQRGWANYKTKFADRAAQAEAEAGKLLDYVFRGAQEPYFSQYRKAMLDWVDKIADTPGGLKQSFTELSAKEQKTILAAISKQVKLEGIQKPGTRAFVKRMREIMSSAARRARTQTSVGDEFGKFSSVGNASEYMTTQMPFALFRHIVNDAADMAANIRKTKNLAEGIDALPKSGPRSRSASGLEESTVGGAMYHLEPETVIAYLEQLLEDGNIWKALGETGDLTVQQLKYKGSYGDVLNPQVRQQLGLPAGDTLVWTPGSGKLKGAKLFKDPVFRKVIENSIEKLKRLEPLNNESRAFLGWEDALFEGGRYARKEGTVASFIDPFSPKGTWVDKSVNEFLAGGARRLPTEGKLELLPGGKGARDLLEEAGEVTTATKTVDTKKVLQRQAHWLGIEGTFKTVNELREAVEDAAIRQPGVVALGPNVVPSAAREMMAQLRRAAQRDYVKGDTLAIPASVSINAADDFDRLVDALAKDPEAFVAGFGEGLTNRARALAETARKSATKDAFLAEGNKGLKGVEDAIMNGQRMDSMPAILWPDRYSIDIQNLGKISLDEILAQFADKAKRNARRNIDDGFALERKLKAIDRATEDIANRLGAYVDLGKKKGAYDTQLRAYYGLPRNQPILVPAKFADQLELNYNTFKELSDDPMKSLLTDLTQHTRKGQTLYNSTALTNNTSANYILQMLARGISPFGLTRRMRDTHSLWKYMEGKEGIRTAKPDKKSNWGKGKSKEEIDEAYAMYVALKNVGVDMGDASQSMANMMAGEFFRSEGGVTRLTKAGAEKLGMTPSQVKKVGKATDIAMILPRWFAKAYAFSDDIFRAEDSVTSWKFVTDRVNRLETGSQYQFRTGHNNWTTAKWIDKDGKRVLTLNGKEVGPRTYRSKDGRIGSPNEWDLVRARAAKFAANQKFVDYSDIPNWPERMRSIALINVLTPHYTWKFHATPVPGRRGIIGRIFTDQVEGRTNSSALQRMDGAYSADKMARYVVINGLHRHQFDPESEAARQVHAWDKITTGNTSRFEQATNPLLVGVDSMKSMNSFDPAVRLGHLVYNMVSGPDLKGASRFALAQWEGDLKKYGFSANSYDDLSKQERESLHKRYQKLGKALDKSLNGRTWEDVADLVGFTSSTIGALVSKLTRRDPKDPRELDMSRIFSREFLPMVMTHVGAKSVDMGAAVLWPTSDLTKINKGETLNVEDQTRGLEYWINTWLGVGAPRRPIKGDAEKAKRILKKRLTNALIPRDTDKWYFERDRILTDELVTREDQIRVGIAVRWRDSVKRAVDASVDRFIDRYYASMKNLRKLRSGKKYLKEQLIDPKTYFGTVDEQEEFERMRTEELVRDEESYLEAVKQSRTEDEEE